MLIVKEITKIYGEQAGIREMSFSAADGDVIAVIGPNGAGKSTLLKIIAGVLKADTGSAWIGDLNTADYSTRKSIGYMPEDYELSHKLTARCFLYMISDYKYEGKFKADIDKAIVDFRLAQSVDKPFAKLSMGMQKKVAMIAAFTGRPKLIILDEPTNGVDTSGIIALKQYIRAAKEAGSVLVISSHILDFVGSVSDSNIFLKGGRIAAVEKCKDILEEKYRQLYLE